MAEIMKAQDTITGSLGECFITIDGNRYNLMQLTNLEATITKSKTTVPILGKTGKGNKASGWEGSGSATLHYNTSLFRELMYKYVKTGQDFYFDIQITNEDPPPVLE